MIRLRSLTWRLVLACVLVAAVVSDGAPRGHSTTEVEQSTRYWAWAYQLDPDTLWQVALCESSGNPWAVGPDSSDGRPQGLFQVKPETWVALEQAENADMALAPRLSQYDPESRGPWSADAAAHIAAWAWAHGYQGLWACSWRVGG